MGNRLIIPTRNTTRSLFAFSILLMALSSCVTWDRLNVFEKNIPIPEYSWHSSFHPRINVDITDTAARYNIYVTLRHNNAYPFSNIWLRVSTEFSGERPVTHRVELPLADQQGRWLGSGMDDIFEHRIPIQQNARFDRQGTYHFTFEQNMRLDPLPHVMSVGLRVEKITP